MAVTLALGALVLSRGIDRPFVTPADTNTAAFAQAARNYVRHGLAATRLGMAYNTGETSPERYAFNIHHPPLAAMAAAGVIVLSGPVEWGARLYPALCALGSLLCLVVLWRKCRGTWPAAAAGIVAATLPTFGHHGKMLGEESPTVFFGLLSYLLYRRWADREDARGSGLPAAGIASYTAGCLSGWAAFYAGPLIAADAFLTLRGRPRKRAAAVSAFLMTGVLILVVVLVHAGWVGGSIVPLLDAARGRAMPASTPPGDWGARMLGYLLRLFGPIPLLAALAGLAALGVRAVWRRQLSGSSRTAAFLILFGAAHPLLFRWAAFYHEWLVFPLFPAVAVGAAEGAALLGGALSAASGPTRSGRGVLSALAAVALAVVAVSGARGIPALEKADRRFGSIYLGAELARATDGRSAILSNFPFLDPSLRFYADRPAARVFTLAELARRRENGDYPVYVRDTYLPVEPDLEAFLSTRAVARIGSFTIHRLDAPAGDSRSQRPDGAASHSLDARFGTSTVLESCMLSGPQARPADPSLVRRWLGLPASAFGPDRLVEVTTSWSLQEAPPPAWEVLVRAGDLPPATLAGSRAPRLAAWSPGGSAALRSGFVLAEDPVPRCLEVRVAVQGPAGPVPPILPGPDVPGRKVVVTGPFPLFAEEDPAAGR